MKDGLLKYLAKGAVGGVLVAAPAFGGQAASGLAKAMSSTVAGLPNALVDLGGCALVGGAEVAVMALIGGKKGAVRAIPLALAGVAVGTLLPIVDDGIDALIRTAVGAPSAKAAVAAASNQPPLQLAASNGAPGGIGSPLSAQSGVPGGIQSRGGSSFDSPSASILIY